MLVLAKGKQANANLGEKESMRTEYKPVHFSVLHFIV